MQVSKRANAYLSSELRRKILGNLKIQGFKLTPDYLLKSNIYSKDRIRKFHFFSRRERLSRERPFINSWFPVIEKYLASGSEIEPERIDPYPVLIESNKEYAALFRIASLWWSVPVSKGFGRRFRILIFDKSNGKLLGLLGLTDPVFNLKPRDNWIGWDVRTREKKIPHIMDAYVLGSVPPYNQLLGAKFVALLAASDFIRKIFRTRYRRPDTLIEGKEFDGRLALVTATSALGRSSIYNRLSIDNIHVYQPAGFTEGYGHFHLADGTFELIRRYLRLIGDPEVDRYKFGNGPNYRFRVVRSALEHLKLPADLLRHGIKRGVFIAPLASNATCFLKGEAERLRWYHRPLDSIVGLWRERWLLPRVKRDSSYRSFDKQAWQEILDGK